MAETVTLRAYLDDVSRLLERGAATEAISHCRYILQHYPRNADTYRLLAQALLQKAQDQDADSLFSEAAEVFQRVLGAMPNDYVAHLGLSEICEHGGQLDQAIWHMERAYEQIPGNQMLQDALRGLYAKRDGEKSAPEKIHLTRGALARQYVNGQLYDQALIELRHALEQNPSRIDLQVMLAETLWESQHPVEAGEIAIQILKRLPNCLAANRILARLWMDNERPSDAQVFLDRVAAVDPYAAAQVLQPDTAVPDPNWLRRLDYSTEAQTTLSQATPDWVQDLGDVSSLDMGSIFQGPSAEAPAPTAPAQSEPSFGVPDVPEWFAPAAQEPPRASAPLQADWLGVPDSASGAELPDWFSELGAPAAGTAQPPASAPLEADWLSGFDDIAALESPVEEPAQPASAAAVEADWLTDFDALGAAQSALDEQPESTEIPAETANDLDWLMPDAAAPEPTGVVPLEAAPPGENWLTGFDEVDISSFEVVQEEEPAEFGWLAEETLPGESEAALGTAAEAEWPAADEFFAEKMADTGVLDDERPPSGFTDILAGVEPRYPVTGGVEPTPPEWIAAFSEEESVPTEPASELTGAETLSWEEAEEQPAAAEAASLSDFESLFAAPQEAPGTPAAEPEPPTSQQSIPDWLTEPESDFFAPPQEQPAAGDWFSGLEEVDETTVAAMSGFAESSPEETATPEQTATDEEKDWFAAADDEGFLAPLEEARVMQPESEIPQDQAAELSEEEPSDWEMAPEGDLGWLTGQETADQMRVMPETDTSEPVAAELPDWIQSAAPEGQGFAEPPAPFEAEIPVVEDWSQLDVGAEFEIGEPGEAPALDWLQPQAAEGDWLGSFAKPQTEVPESEPVDLSMAFPAEDAGSQPELVEQAEPEQAPASGIRATDEWLAAIPDVELGVVSDEPETAVYSFEDVEASIFGAEAEVTAPESDMAQPSQVGQAADSDVMAGEASELGVGEIPTWMADLEPIQIEDQPSPAVGDEDLFAQPYDSFASGSAEQVPEYRSAKETGILQPDESPDWMAAFGSEEVPLQIDETAEELASGEGESLLEALGLEADEESPAEAALGGSERSLGDEGATLPAEGDSEIPDWLSAITTAATGKYDDLAFEQEKTYSQSDEALGVVSDSELDWLAPLKEEPEAVQDAAGSRDAASPLDLETMFADVEGIGAELVEDKAADLDLGELDFGDLAPADRNASEQEDIRSWFGEAKTDEPGEAELFDFDFDDIQVAQPADLTDTREAEANKGETPWLDEEESVPDNFTFDEVVPRWLRQPKEGGPASQADQDSAPMPPDWLRSVFDDNEFEE